MFILHFAVVWLGLVVRGYGREWCEVSVFCLWSAVVDSLYLLRVCDVAVFCKHLRRVHCRDWQEMRPQPPSSLGAFTRNPSETTRKGVVIPRSNILVLSCGCCLGWVFCHSLWSTRWSTLLYSMLW